MLEGETQTSNIKIKEDRGSRIEKEKTLAHTRASKKKKGGEERANSKALFFGTS